MAVLAHQCVHLCAATGRMGNKIISILNAFTARPRSSRLFVCLWPSLNVRACVWAKVIEFLFKATEMALKAKLSANASNGWAMATGYRIKICRCRASIRLCCFCVF